MAKSKSRDPIPAGFATLAEAAEFWDTHDLGDYADQTQEVDVDVKIDRRGFLHRSRTGLGQEGFRLRRKARGESRDPDQRLAQREAGGCHLWEVNHVPASCPM